MRSSSSELLLDRGASKRHHRTSRGGGGRRRHEEEDVAGEEDEEEAGEEEDDEGEGARYRGGGAAERVSRSPSRSRKVRPSEGRGAAARRDAESEERREALLGGPAGRETGGGSEGRRWEAWGDGDGVRRGVVDEAFGGRTDWSDEDSWGVHGLGGQPGMPPGFNGRGAPRGRVECKRKKKRRSWGQRLRFYLTAFLALALTSSASALLFLVPLYVDPAVSTLRADFRPEPAVCVTSRRVDRAGLANCSLTTGPSSSNTAALPAASSCREGCTSDLYHCTQIFVLYSPASVYRVENDTESSTDGATSPLPTTPDEPTVPPAIPSTKGTTPATSSASTSATISTTTASTTSPTARSTTTEAASTSTAREKATATTESADSVPVGVNTTAVATSTISGGVVLTSPSTDSSTDHPLASSPPPPVPEAASSPESSSLAAESTSPLADTASSPTKRERRRVERSLRHHHVHDEEEEEDEEEEDEEDDDDEEEDDEEDEEGDDDLEEAVLLVNIKGCGYPPEVSCTDFLKQYGLAGSTFPCYYSRANHSLVLAQYEPSRERARIVNMFVAPFAVAAASASALCFLHCECCRRSPRGRGMRGMRGGGGGGGGRLLLEGPGRRRGRVEHLRSS
ncbi:uncharacterized protein [Hetaerina americana]|uniref:uncharacterized protein n=1 Tax=Hetaerina americana TaxID=62018 RepID=UPI003A7F4A50